MTQPVEPVLQKFHQIIVARYTENVEWTNSFNNVLIYDKYDQDPMLNSVLSQTQHQIIQLPNVGREAHTYYSHICRIYDELLMLGSRELSEYYLVFLQGNPFDHSPNLLENLRKILDVRNANFRFDYLSETCETSDFLREILIRLKCTDIHNTFIKLFYKNPEKVTKINNTSFYFGEGGQFIVSGEAVLSRPKSFYENVVKILQISIDPMQGYDIERFHKVIFEPTDEQKTVYGELNNCGH